LAALLAALLAVGPGNKGKEAPLTGEKGEGGKGDCWEGDC
jgi:hypothetical protein